MNLIRKMRASTLAVSYLITTISGSAIAQAQSEEKVKPKPKPKSDLPSKPTTLDVKGLPPIWIQGEPIKAFEKDHLYVFEFWATWCAPCIAQMPHVEELHQHFKDNDAVTIVGVNVFDATPAEKIKKFIKSKKVNYPIAWDGAAKGPVATMWLKPLGIEGVPHAIAVRNGNILWAGHAAILSKDLITKMMDPSFSTEKLSQEADLIKQKKIQAEKDLIALVRRLKTLDAEQSLAILATYASDPEVSDTYKVKAYWQMFDINFKKDEHVIAQKALIDLAEKMPKHYLAQITVATSVVCTDELENKNLALAIKSLERCAAIKPSKAELSYKYIADAKLMMGDREGAIQASEKALQSNPAFKKMEALKSTLKK